MDRLGDRVEAIERKYSWEAQVGNPTRNPNFRKNPNLNSGKTSPDQNIRPPFQENYAEASTSNEPTEDPQISLMGLKSEEQIFLTQDEELGEAVILTERGVTLPGLNYDVVGLC